MGKPKGFICEEVNDRIYRFYFDNDFDANMKLRRQPWNINGQLLMLRPWEKEKDLASYNFDHVALTVQVWGLPKQFYNVIICKNLCSHAGSVLETGIYPNFGSQGLIPKAVVLIDVSKPLTLGAYLDTDDDNGKVWVDFKYEKLPIFCYYCGKIGHEEQGCLELMKDERENNVHSFKYSHTLEADQTAQFVDILEYEEHNKKYYLQNQGSMLKSHHNKSTMDQVSQHLSSLYVTEKRHEFIGKDHELNPTLDQSQMEDKLQLGMLKFKIGCNPNDPSMKSKNKVKIIHKGRPYPSYFSTLITGPIDKTRHEYRAMKRRSSGEVNENKEGKRVCSAELS